MQVNQATLAALYKGYRTQYAAGYNGSKPQWDQIAQKATSNNAEEVYHMLGAMPGMRKLVDEIRIRNRSALKYSIANDEFELTVGVKRADIDRDRFGLYNTDMQAMGMVAASHPDKLLAALMQAGFAAPCYTGKNFFDTNHEPFKGKTKFSNKGTDALTADSYKAARANMLTRLNPEGETMDLGVDLVLIHGPLLESTALEICKNDTIQKIATNKAGTENIGVSTAPNTLKGTCRPVMWTKLGSSLNWFLLEAGWPMKPFIFQEELPTEFQSLTAPDADHVFKRKEFLYQAYGRYNAGYGLPELAFGSKVDA